MSSGSGRGGRMGRLTFDMRGGRQQAKPDVGRPLDGRVRALWVQGHELPTRETSPCNAVNDDMQSAAGERQTCRAAAERTDCTAQHVGAKRPCEADLSTDRVV